MLCVTLTLRGQFLRPFCCHFMQSVRNGVNKMRNLILFVTKRLPFHEIGAGRDHGATVQVEVVIHQKVKLVPRQGGMFCISYYIIIIFYRYLFLYFLRQLSSGRSSQSVCRVGCFVYLTDRVEVFQESSPFSVLKEKQILSY